MRWQIEECKNLHRYDTKRPTLNLGALWYKKADFEPDRMFQICRFVVQICVDELYVRHWVSLPPPPKPPEIREIKQVVIFARYQMVTMNFIVNTYKHDTSIMKCDGTMISALSRQSGTRCHWASSLIVPRVYKVSRICFSTSPATSDLVIERRHILFRDQEKLCQDVNS